MRPLLVILFLFSSSTWGETPVEQISRIQNEEEFRALDLNGDFFVSAAEAAGHAEIVRGFDKADRNHDGKLSRAEFERLKKAKSAAVGGTAKKRPKSGSAAH
jgi:hypothetical protein